MLQGSPVGAVRLGERDLPRQSVVTYLFAGHSNILSGQQGITHPRAWNYIVPGAWERPEGWTLAHNPLHVSYLGPRPRLGPGMPFLMGLADAHPGYYIGMLQNPNPQATARWIQPNPPRGIAPLHNRYVPGTTLYNELVERAVALEPDVTIGGLVIMLGLMEARDLDSAQTFSDDIVTMVTAFRDALGKPALPVLIGIGEWQSPGNGAHWQTVRDEILTLPDRLASLAIVDPDLQYPEHYSDVFHYNAEGHTRWANEAIRLIEENGWFPTASEPNLGLSHDIVRFCIRSDETSPATKTVTIANTGAGSLGTVSTAVTYADGAAWLTVGSSGSGQETALQNVVDTQALAAGSFSATVSVHAVGAINSPQTYEVRLVVDSSFEVVELDLVPPRATAQLGTETQLTASATNACDEPEPAMFRWSVSGGGQISPHSNDSAAPSHTSSFIADGTLGLFDVHVTSGAVSARGVVETLPAPEILLLAPTADEVLVGGSTEMIEWTAHNLDDVSILLSVDDGQTWESIEPSISDMSPHWQNHPWKVPQVMAANARLHLQGYFGEAPVTSAAFTIICSGAAGAECEGRLPVGVDRPGPGCRAASGNQTGLAVLLTLALLRRRSRPRRERPAP